MLYKQRANTWGPALVFLSLLFSLNAGAKQNSCAGGSVVVDQNVIGLSPSPGRVPLQVPKHLLLQEETEAKWNSASRV